MQGNKRGRGQIFTRRKTSCVLFSFPLFFPFSFPLFFLYTYDHANRLVDAHQYSANKQTLLWVKYSYDPYGRLYERVELDSRGNVKYDKEIYLYDGQNVWATLAIPQLLGRDLEPVVATRFIHGDAVDQTFARIDLAGSTSGI